MDDHQKNIKFAKLFVRLDELQAELNNSVIPLCYYLKLNEQNNELSEKLEAAAKEIENFINRYQVSIIEKE